VTGRLDGKIDMTNLGTTLRVDDDEGMK